MPSAAQYQTHLSQAVGRNHAHKVLQGQQLRHLAGVVVAHGLQDELALGYLHPKLGLLVLCKKGLQAVVGTVFRGVSMGRSTRALQAHPVQVPLLRC